MADMPPDDLRELARSHGVQLEYLDTSGATKPASTASLLGVLRALGVELSGEAEAGQALRERRLSLWRRRIEPVVVVWEGEPVTADLRIQAHRGSASLRCRLVAESGEEHAWTTPADGLPLAGSAEVEGERFIVRRLALPEGLPTGYHRLTIEFDGREAAESLVIVAPTRAYTPPIDHGKRPWGIFCPLYALHGSKSGGAGDHSDLEALMDWTAGQGGGLVATLPMLASVFDGPDPVVSPYSPTSRLFWNEFYLDLDRIPELAASQAAREYLASDHARDELAALRSAETVDYGRQMRFKRAAIEMMADSFFETENTRTTAFRDFVRDHPNVEAYAFFQAAGERFGRDWRRWPAALDGPGRDSEVDPRARNYHLFAQWQADEQLKALAGKARDKGLTWYLDFPIGVDLNSFDVWSERDAFATGASVGCPPDLVFTKGQNWGFPPLHPARQREQGYRYLIASFRNHLRYANALRIDHVMGLHRLFWIPDGAEARDGAYVSTPAEEIYAILSVESHRRKAWLVGEDLGTVPPEVAGALGDHGVRGMYVIQYEIHPDTDEPLRAVPEATVASVNTHDMPPFAAFWEGIDLDDRKDLGLLDEEALIAERKAREDQRDAMVEHLRAEGHLTSADPDTAAVLHAVWAWLAASPARILLLNVEDSWLETESQNTPNTYVERPNWRRKLRRPFEKFSTDPIFLAALERVEKLRSEPARVVAEKAVEPAPGKGSSKAGLETAG